MKFASFVFDTLLGVASLFLWANVLQDWWLWFIVPGFGAAELSFKTAVGLAFGHVFVIRGLAMILTDKPNHADPNKTLNRPGVRSICMMLFALWIWGWAWLYQHFL